MAKPRDITEMFDYIRSLADASQRAASLATIQTGQYAHVEAVKNVRTQFTGRNNRTLSGGLLNSIYVEYDAEPKSPVLEVHLGTRGIPYGRIHEFGGEIEPVKAEKLWIPQYKYAGRMTPTEFMELRRQNPKLYVITPDMAGRRDNPSGGNDDITPLFMRVDRVEIPERPYLRPALTKAALAFVRFFTRQLANETKNE